MRNLMGICAMLLALGWLVPVCAAEESGKVFAFGKDNAKLYQVIYTAPLFDGTGYASQSFLKHAPYRGAVAVSSRPDHSDYYRLVREMS